MREARKKEHVENYLKTSFKGNTLLGDIFIEHNALPNIGLDDINTKTIFLDKTIDFPIIINAMTGGAEFAWEINKKLATIARDFNIPMAVGSQTIALCDDEECKESFKIVRETIGSDGLVIANLNAQATVEEVKFALDMIEADAIQLHLNPAQELVMSEGDKDFKGILSNIHHTVKSIDKPVIVKEVGFGISKDVASRLYDAGVRNIDISGFGGTNFIEIENIRNMDIDFSELYNWGIPTALSLIKCRELPKDLKLIASGGIRDSMDIVKALIIGGDVVGISGEILSYLLHGGYENSKDYLESTIYKMKIIMTLLGKRNIEDLKNTKYKVVGRLKELI